MEVRQQLKRHRRAGNYTFADNRLSARLDHLYCSKLGQSIPQRPASSSLWARACRAFILGNQSLGSSLQVDRDVLKEWVV